MLGKAFSDHNVISFIIDTTKPKPRKKVITLRNLKSLNHETFSPSVKNDLCGAEGNCKTLAELYNTVLHHHLDQKAPLRVHSIPCRQSAPWLSLEFKRLKQERRRAERRWRKSRLTVYRQIFKKLNSDVKARACMDRRNYYSTMINDCTSSKVLFKISKDLSAQDKTIALPKMSTPEELPDKFCTFFHNRVVQIRESLDNDHDPRSLPTSQSFQCEHFVAFKSVSCQTVKNIIKACPPKSCHLVHNHIDDLVPLITTIVNASFCEGTVPSCFKVASVSPLLKKPGLDPDDMKNYRPVSNLPFLSKVLEKLVLSQLKYHLSKNELFDPFQSA